MNKILILILMAVISNFSYAGKLSKPEKDQKMQKLLEERYNLSKDDFLRYSKKIDSVYLFTYVVLAHEANKPMDTIFSFASNYNKPLEKSFDVIESQILSVILLAVVFARESGHTYDEIMKMSDDGDPIKMESLAKTLDIKHDRLFKTLNEIRPKLGLQPKDYN